MDKINCVRVNADYESVLFLNRPGSLEINYALEFLAFYLQRLPVLTKKEYSENYLEMIRSLTGNEARTCTTGKALNWWGELKNPERERWMNSKLTSTELAIKHGWTKARILSKDELSGTIAQKDLLVKDPFGMSGRGMMKFSQGQMIDLPKSYHHTLIAEPILERVYDFSHYVFSDGKVILYENMVDEKFQYRGSIIGSGEMNFDSLSFSQEIKGEEKDKFKEALEVILSHYGDPGVPGYSVDSFVYRDEGELHIYPLAEINARRTMGLCAYELSKILGTGSKSALSLQRPIFKDAILLSPPGVRFEMYFGRDY